MSTAANRHARAEAVLRDPEPGSPNARLAEVLGRARAQQARDAADRALAERQLISQLA